MFYVYILASQRNGALYTGTDDIGVFEHKEKTFRGFAARYGVDRLVWYEGHESREAAFLRERQIKEWKRAWKIEMIERFNPGWLDLCEEGLLN